MSTRLMKSEWTRETTLDLQYKIWNLMGQAMELRDRAHPYKQAEINLQLFPQIRQELLAIKKGIDTYATQVASGNTPAAPAEAIYFQALSDYVPWELDRLELFRSQTEEMLPTLIQRAKKARAQVASLRESLSGSGILTSEEIEELCARLENEI